MAELKGKDKGEALTLVTRKPCFGLPTACPSCLPVYIYLRLCQIPFQLSFNLQYPDSEQIPYVESGEYAAYNNEKGGVIENLREDGIVDLDSDFYAIPEWLSMKVMMSTWLVDAVLYELWLGPDSTSPHKIYYSDLPWPIGKILHFKQIQIVKQLLGICKDNTERREGEILRKASIAYGALSTSLGEQLFFFGNRPSSLDAIFLGHALFTLQALPETSILRNKLLEHTNLVKYAENLKARFLEADPSSSSSQVPLFHSSPWSSVPKRGPSTWSEKPKSKPKREKTEEEKKFRRRAKYFLATQVIAVLLFLSLMGGSDDGEVELDDDHEGLD